MGRRPGLGSPFWFPDGGNGMRQAKAGEILVSEAVTHSPVNASPTDAHGILIELKEQAGGRPASLGDDGGLTAITYITGLVGREDELRRELLALSAPTRAEPGNLRYDLYQSTTKPNEFVRFEVWRDSAALEAHKATPHLRASFARRQDQGWRTNITLWQRADP
jgi:quinol monooxygenase YgiN